jgi:hypothetical protein
MMYDDLKSELLNYLEELSSDYDDEIEECKDLISTYDKYLTGLSPFDKSIILNLVDDPLLYEAVENIFTVDLDETLFESFD